MEQTSLPPAPPPPAPRPGQRRTSKGIAKGDIVEVDRKGRRHAIVTGIEQLPSGRFELDVRPLDSRISYRRATVRQGRHRVPPRPSAVASRAMPAYLILDIHVSDPQEYAAYRERAPATLRGLRRALPRPRRRARGRRGRLGA